MNDYQNNELLPGNNAKVSQTNELLSQNDQKRCQNKNNND